MSEQLTPETDEVRRTTDCNALGYGLMTLHACKLERERDEARNERDKLKQLLLAADSDVDAYLGVLLQRDEARGALTRITEAAQAVVDRWEQPAWKDTEPTAAVIYRLRDALGREAE